MQKIEKKFKTKYTAMEMKNYISTKIIPNPVLSGVMDSAFWEGNKLYVNSKFGRGHITLSDYLLEVSIELNLFGSLAYNAIDSALDKEFKQLT